MLVEYPLTRGIVRVLRSIRGGALVSPASTSNKEVTRIMRRVLIVLTVAALVAAMMVSAGPAQANETNLESGINAFQVGDTLIASGDDDFDLSDSDFGFGFGDVFGFDGVDGLVFFDGDDDQHFGDGDIDEGHRLACFSS